MTTVRTRGRTTAALLVAALGSASLAAVLLDRFLDALAEQSGPWRVETAVELGIVAAGALAALWLSCSTLLAVTCVLVRASGARWRAGERLVQRYAPQVVRKALVLAVGAGLGLGLASGASAAAPDPAPTTTAATATASTDDLGWVVTGASTDDAARTASSTVPAAPAPPTEPPTPAPAPGSAAPTRVSDPAPTVPDVGTVVVAAGDSLWAIAARHLPAGATDAQIADAWPRWYQANASVVGPDPDVIQVGQVLTAPAPVGGESR